METDLKVGFLLLGHRDYSNNIGKAVADKAVAALRARGVDVVYPEESIVDPIAARSLALGLVGKDLDGVIYFLGTWIECPTAMGAIRELEHLPFALWGFPQFIREADSSLVKKGEKDSTGSYVALAVLKGALTRMGYRYSYVSGMPDSIIALEKALSFCKVAHTIKALKRLRVGMIGYASMGMYPGTFDHVLLRRFIGPEVVPLDSYTLINRMQSISPASLQLTLARLAESAFLYQDATPEKLEQVGRMYEALKLLVDENHLDAINVKCQYELSQEYGCVACVPCSLLADSGVVTACEGDIMITVSMAILNLLTGQVIYYGDVLDWDDGKVLLSSCGFLPFSLSKHKPIIRELGHPGFKGLINSGVLKEGEITMMRLCEGRGDYLMKILVGEGVETKPRMGRFPALSVQLNCSEEEFLDGIMSQHYCIAYGNWTKELRELCHFMDIKCIMNLD